MLTAEGCKGRLLRVRNLMLEKQWDALLLTDSRNVCYLEAVVLKPGTPVFLWISGESTPQLATDSATPPVSAEVVPFESYSPRRVLDQPWHEAILALAPRLKGHVAKRVGVEKDSANGMAIDLIRDCLPQCEIVDVSAELADLRRSRDPDEVDVIRQVSAVAEAGFSRAREVIQPGISEIELYIEISGAMIAQAGGPVEIGGDFATGPRSLTEGGVPIERRIESGDLCVYDLFPQCWGYGADLCRAMAVGPATPVQERGHEIVCRALELAETLLEPGRPAREAYQLVHDFLEKDPLSAGTFWHHLGHGVGMGGHENPRLIPESDHVLRLGDVISVEPAFYNPELQGGLRIENTYWLSAEGPIQLNSHPTNL